MKLIDGKAVSASLKEALKEQVATFPEKYGRVPHLVVVRVGEDPASVVYVRNKAKACLMENTVECFLNRFGRVFAE